MLISCKRPIWGSCWLRCGSNSTIMIWA
jgi:hypothetical protein